MNNFVSLKSGLIINLGAVALIRAGGPAREPRGIEIVFPSLGAEGSTSSLSLLLKGEQADEFSAKLNESGINIDYLAEALKEKPEESPGSLSKGILTGQANIQLAGK